MKLCGADRTLMALEVADLRRPIAAAAAAAPLAAAAAAAAAARAAAGVLLRRRRQRTVGVPRAARMLVTPEAAGMRRPLAAAAQAS